MNSSMKFADTECAHALLELAVRAPLANAHAASLDELHLSLSGNELESNDLVKRIRLDHNYVWPAGYKAPGNRPSFADSIVKDDQQQDKYPQKRRKTASGSRSGLSVADGDVSSSDLYEPSDSKFNNLHLLLGCLNNEDGRPAGRRRCHSSPSLRQADQRDSSSDGPLWEVAERTQFNCSCCKKTFNKRRYLTKHIRRMHPASTLTQPSPPILVLCPNCGVSVPRRQFERHSTGCHTHLWKTKRQLEVDLANCQFCGVRMRRHVLVRHLASEHCIEKRALDGENDDDDSASSGGEDVNCEGHLVGCPLCVQRMPRGLLVSHLTEVHWVAASSDDTLIGRSLLKAILDNGDRQDGYAPTSRADVNSAHAPVSQLGPVTV